VKITTLITGWIAVGTLALIPGGVAAAEEPTPTPKPTPVHDGDLSSVAGSIKLNTDGTTESGGSIVITNENLPELAGKGSVTEVTKPGGTKGRRALTDVQGEGPGIEGKPQGYAEKAEKKQYWQGMYVQQVELMGNIISQIEVLDYEIPGLWRDFYAWDDPAYRDGVIKPKLDSALAQRQQLEQELQEAQGKLDEIKSGARRDGGEPGWFRGLPTPPVPKPTQGIKS